MTGPKVRELHHVEEFQDVYRLFDTIWQPDPRSAPISVEMMVALSHAGNYVAGAYDGDRLVGASVAFLAGPAGEALHSHITGATIGRGIGLALKHHQRDWALDRGLRRITWTFDPLVRRNAHFNLAKLGAMVEAYLPSFYGAMDDAINSGDESDRALVVWHLSAPQDTAEPDLTAAVTGLSEQDGRPVPGSTDAETVLVSIPEDIESLRKHDPEAARAWRLAVREVLGGLLDDGARVTGFHRKSSYVVRREHP